MGQAESTHAQLHQQGDGQMGAPLLFQAIRPLENKSKLQQQLEVQIALPIALNSVPSKLFVVQSESLGNQCQS